VAESCGLVSRHFVKKIQEHNLFLKLYQTMQTLTIKINNPHALRLIEELEALKLIEVIKKNVLLREPGLSERLAGSITAAQATRMRDELQQSRDEWERNF